MNSYSIDWHEQWRLHGANFRDGFVHVELPGTTLKLKPGPGFGDLSHTTTTLVLEMMQGHVKDRHVVDIGSGSGVLALASDVLGAHTAVGVDVDNDSVYHAKENALINSSKANFYHSNTFKPKSDQPLFVVMNMITSEQAVAWDFYSSLWGSVSDIIVSGILYEERDNYVQEMQKKGWKLSRERVSKGWCALHLKKK